ncbi:hypothetical protein H5410_045525 [Solanum commersonii]|uniref:Uncharacterized protein n=1 Tax=Solanum commersonii TaxID=4109 RepID=A0A9J5X9U4_SOLCO|nr:hypothetical protein H5410_045525 [Solanum commersonii]
MDRSTVGMKIVIEGNDVTAILTDKQSSKPSYKNPNVFCDHCKSKGHVRGDCYQFIRYPSWFKGKKKEGCNVQYNTHVSSQNPPLFNSEYGVHNAKHMISPSYGNLPFSQNHNVGEICKQGGGHGHRSGDCFFPSTSQGSGGYSQVAMDNYSPGHGNAEPTAYHIPDMFDFDDIPIDRPKIHVSTISEALEQPSIPSAPPQPDIFEPQSRRSIIRLSKPHGNDSKDWHWSCNDLELRNLGRSPKK